LLPRRHRASPQTQSGPAAGLRYVEEQTSAGYVRVLHHLESKNPTSSPADIWSWISSTRGELFPQGSSVWPGQPHDRMPCRPHSGGGPRVPGRPIVIERRPMSLRTHSVNGPAGPAANISTAPGRGRRLRAAVKRGPSRDSVSIYCPDDRHVSHPTRSAVVRAIERARRPSPACSLGFFSFFFLSLPHET